MSTLISILFCAAYSGWLLAKLVPLLPNWIGALGGTITVGYAATLPDSRGDLLRYLGHCVVSCLSVVVTTLDEVMLKEKLSVLLGHLLFFSRAVDDKYQILARLQLLFAEFLRRLTMAVSRCELVVNHSNDCF